MLDINYQFSVAKKKAYQEELLREKMRLKK